MMCLDYSQDLIFHQFYCLLHVAAFPAKLKHVASNKTDKKN